MGKKTIFKKRYFLIVFLIGWLILFSSCKKAVLLAPNGSVFIVTARPTIIELGESSVITVVGFKPSGTPLVDGTVVYFMSDIGSVDSQAEFKDGMAKATFHSDDGLSGAATITIVSGIQAENPKITITVTAFKVTKVNMQANPMILPPGGGRSTISAVVLDQFNEPMAGVPVFFSTSAGSLKSKGAAVYTNANGRAEDILTTNVNATISLIVGDITSPTVDVTVATNVAPKAEFVFSPSTQVINQPVNFNASASSDTDGSITSYSWDFGDGSRGGGVRVSHPFSTAGKYTVTLTVRDNFGAQGTISKEITITLI